MTLETLKANLLSECEEDHIGLWSVFRDVEQFLPDRDPISLREVTLSLLDELLTAQQIQAGFPSEDGREFCPVDLATPALLDWVKNQWPLGKRPTIGEIIWFNRTR